MKKIIVFLVVITLLVLGYFYQQNAADVETQAFWNSADESNEETIDHSDWQDLLEAYVVEGDEPSINLFAYAEFEEDDRELLEDYLAEMQAVDPRQYSGAEQQAYWINVYNALTVKLILDNYPVESITKLGDTLASFGPWDDEMIIIAGQTLSLNDIEHSILRPIWRDSRVHFAVNCASIGCPDLQATAFTAANLNELLDKGATDYLAHPRGMLFDGDTLTLSKIFDWYGEDFGTNEQEVLRKLSAHAPQAVRNKLLNYQGSIKYEYDWSLNEVQ